MQMLPRLPISMMLMRDMEVLKILGLFIWTVDCMCSMVISVDVVAFCRVMGIMLRLSRNFRVRSCKIKCVCVIFVYPHMQMATL